ncbi:MAG: ATP-binding protein [Candidatus Edwardsbacteria bacterium]
MQDLSLHILDIAENSIAAGAKKIKIVIKEDLKKDLLKLNIVDDGKGMNKNTLKRVLDPFFTTKNKKVGLGLPLLTQAARMSGGDIKIESSEGRGTNIVATFQHSHIDRKPLGDIANTLITLIIGNPEVEFSYIHIKDGKKFSFATQETKKRLKGITLNSPEGIRIIRKKLVLRRR